LGIGDHIVQWQRLGDVLNQCLQKTLSITSIEVGSPFIDSTTGFRPTEIILVTTLVDPKRYPKAKLAHLYQLRWQATEVNFKHLKTTLKMEMILPKPGNGAERNLDAFACVQLAAKLDVAIGAAIAGVALGCPCKELDNSSISSDRVGSDNRPKPSLPLLNPAPCHQ